MPIEEINAYTPQLYRSLGTPVTLDLGTTANDVAVTRGRVEALPKVVSDATWDINQGIGELSTAMVNSLADAVEAIKQAHQTAINDIRNELKTQSTEGFEAVLTAIGNFPVPAPIPVPAAVVVAETSAPLVRLLIQVQALALDGTPGEPYTGKEPQYKGWIKEDVTLDNLRRAAEREAVALLQAPQHLRERFMSAFRTFISPDLTSRSLRFAEVHALIPEIAAFLAAA